MKITSLHGAAVALAAGVALAGCGASASVSIGDSTIDPADVEKVVIDNLRSTSTGQIEARSAVCPDDVEAEAGTTFDCTVVWEDGGRGSVTIHLRSDDGEFGFTQRDVTYPPVRIDGPATERLVRENSTFTTGERAVVSCPDDVLSTPGSTFRCDLDVGGSKGTVTLHVTSREGDVRFDESDIRDAP